jgi:hypothetical protein
MGSHIDILFVWLAGRIADYPALFGGDVNGRRTDCLSLFLLSFTSLDFMLDCSADESRLLLFVFEDTSYPFADPLRQMNIGSY